MYNFLIKALILTSCIGLASCTFPKRVSRVSLKNLSPGKTIYFISSEGFEWKFNRSDFIGFLLNDSTTRTFAPKLDSLFSMDKMNLDSISDKGSALNWHFSRRGFITQQIEQGKVEIRNLKTGKNIYRVKKKTKYYRESRFSKKRKMFVGYYSQDEQIFSVLYMTIRF